MSREPENELPPEIDFTGGSRGRHHLAQGSKVFMPVSIEGSVWNWFADKAEQRGVDLSELVTDVLRRDIEIGEALK